MRTSSRALIGFGAAIAVLVIVTIVLVLTLGKGNAALLSEKTPEGTVQRYLIAIQDQNYAAAYQYLSPQDLSPQVPENIKEPVLTYDNWLTSVQQSANSTWKADLGKVTISGDTASVTITIDVFREEGRLGNPVNTHDMTFMLKKADTGWLIISPTDLYWLY